jgi:hypothetical protein
MGSAAAMTPDEFGRLVARVTALENGQAAMLLRVDENTRITIQVRDNTAEIVKAFNSAKGAFQVAEWLGKCAKIVAAIAVALGLIWGAIKWGGK